MSDITILHISDLHFSSNMDKKKEKEIIMNSLIKEIQTAESSWKPQIVCISGDIVDKYDVNAYPIAKEWFEQLAEKLMISVDHFMFIPGNHDCSRDVMQFPIIDSTNDELVNKVLGCTIPEYLRGRFKAYEDFCKELNVIPYSWTSGDNYLVGYRVLENIVFYGCNTEWFAYEDDSKLRLGKKIVDELQNCNNNCDELKRIAIMHHGVETGFHENEIQYHNSNCPALHHLWRICDMTLYGHSHEQTGGSPNKMEDHCYTIRAGASSMNQNHPNNVNMLKIKDNSFELKYINYNPQNVESPWQMLEESKEYFWNGNIKNEVQNSNISIKDIEEFREKESIFVKDIMENKLRQVKISGELPQTILRKVVVQQKYKDSEEMKSKIETVCLEDVIFAEKRVIVQGDLGAGKSTILAQMVLNLLENSNDYFPLFISAKELAKCNEGKVNSVLDGILLFMREQLLVKFESINNILEHFEHCYLFVDGLDEVEKKYQERLIRVLEQIPLMASQFSVVLSTRATETIEYHRDNWKQCNLEGLQQEEIFQILKNEAVIDQKTDKSDIFAKQFLDIINQNPMVQLVANTPLAVRLLYHVMKKNGNIDTQTIGDLLNLLLEERIERWDEKNTREVIEEEFEKTFPTIDEKKRFIGYLAYIVEESKITRKKLELMLDKDTDSQVNVGLLVEQTMSKLSRNGLIVEENGQLLFVYRPLSQLAMGIYLANEIIMGKVQAQELSLDLWREISFAAGELRRADLLNEYRSWFLSYFERLKDEMAGLVKACYICYESKDVILAQKMIDNFRERDIRPLWYYEEERNVSLNIVAQTIALSGTQGIDWFIDSYLTLTYPVINAGSAFFSELYVMLAPLIRDKLTPVHKKRLQNCIEALEYVCPIAYIRLPEILCYLMPEMYSLERRLQLTAKIAGTEAYKSWALDEYKKISKEHNELCDSLLKRENSFCAAYLWMNIFEKAPNINILAKIIEFGTEQLIEECCKRLGAETYVRYLRWLLASSSHSIAAASAFQLCNEGESERPEIKKALVGGMINARKHNKYERKIIELINKDGGLSKDWISILFTSEHHVYGASEGCWRIFLGFLVKSEEDMSEVLIKNLPFMGPYLLARCEETRLLLCRLLLRREYKEALLHALNILNPEISHVASKIGVIACSDLEADCLYTVVSESAHCNSDNMEWQNYIVERKYQEKTLQQLCTKLPSMNKSMEELTKRILKFNDNTLKNEAHEISKEEWIFREIESVSKYGIKYLRAYLKFLNNNVNDSLYCQMQEKYKFYSNVEVLRCFQYVEGKYEVDWNRLLWLVYIGNNGGIHDIDIFSLELIAYGKENEGEIEAILKAVKEICADERLEKNRWVTTHHWLLLIIYTFEGIDDTVIKEAFEQKEEYLSESSLALISIYSGDLEELNIKTQRRKIDNEIAKEIDKTDCNKALLDYAKESDKIPKNLDGILQYFIQENDKINLDYINELVKLGENGSLIAGIISYCYGISIPLECGMIVHQSYFSRFKLESEVFKKLLLLTRNVFNIQLKKMDKLQAYKSFLIDLESHIEELSMKKNFIIYEYLYYLSDLVTTEKIIYFIDLVMDGTYFSKYTNSIWKLMIPHIISKDSDEKKMIFNSVELAIHRIIGTCEEKRSYCFRGAFDQIALSCIYWYLNDEYLSLAQPIFERGVVELFRIQKEQNQLEQENSYEILEKLDLFFEILPRQILQNAIQQMKSSWLYEAKILGRMIEVLVNK